MSNLAGLELQLLQELSRYWNLSFLSIAFSWFPWSLTLYMHRQSKPQIWGKFVQRCWDSPSIAPSFQNVSHWILAILAAPSFHLCLFSLIW